MPGLDTLHTHVELTYTFDNGHEERLIIGADLLHHLLEMRDGYQLTGNQSEDLFANLSVFKQRLAQEGDRAVFAWNPQKDRVFQVAVFPRDGVQKIVLKDVTGEVSG